MKTFLKSGVLVLALAVLTTAPEAHAAKKKVAKQEKSSARKPAAASRGFKVKISGEFTRVIDEEQGIVCYFAKQGGGSCVNLPK